MPAEIFVYAMSANLVGGQDGAGYGGAESGETEEIVSSTLSFSKLGLCESMFAWRDWRLGHQRGVSELVAREFTEHLLRNPAG